MLTAGCELERVRDFQQRTREKLADVRCPLHRKAPRLEFHGSDLREMTVSLSGCCERLLRIANKAIAAS